MSQQTRQGKHLDTKYEENFTIKWKPWSYADPSTNLRHNRICSSPVDEFEETDNEEDNHNSMQSVEVQTDGSALLSLKQDRKIDIKRVNSQFEDLRRNVSDHSKLTELDNVRLKRIKPFGNENISVKLPAEVSRTEVFDEYAETDLDQPMDYALCYNETNLDEERKENSDFTKNDFPCVEEMIEEEKTFSIKPKSFFLKESTKNKKELFSNPSKSFREIFNFFKDRDKKRSNIENKLERSRVSKQTPINYDVPSEKSQVEQSKEQMKIKSEAQGFQETPLVFSRCSSVGSLTGLEQNSIPDDRSSIISDVSRKTSGITSPTDLCVSPALGSVRSQLKNQIGFFVKKKIQHLQQERIKICQHSVSISDTSVQSESILKKPLVKHSVFEDNLTLFKDESTPTKLHSMVASSLSSLTIDDDYDDEMMHKLISCKEKQNIPNEMKVANNRKEPIGECNHQIDSSSKSEVIETESQIENDEILDEENDKVADLTPYEEQLLDRCIRRGIAKWTRQNINEIEPFSWDLGLTCRATRTILTSKIRLNSDIDIQNNIIKDRKDYRNRQAINYNDSNNNPESMHDEISDEEPQSIEEFHSGKSTHDLHNSYNITYEEHLLDECIRRGMAKITKRNVSDIKPFSWDINQICLTTRAMRIHNRTDDIHKDL